MDVPLVIGLIVLFVFSAFFSCAETAFTSLSHVRLERLSIKSKSAKAALFLEDHYDRLLSTILIGNNIVNIAASTLGTILFVSFLGETNGALVSTVVITVVVLIFGEITPKNISKAAPEKFAIFCAYPLMFFYWLFLPLSWLFDKMMDGLRFVFHLGKKEPTLTEDELKMVVSDIKEEGVINQSEHDLIQKSIAFDDKTVNQIMVPWDKVVKVYDTDTDFEIKNMFEVNNYSRVPYIDKDSGEVLGFLLQKDFYEMLLEQNSTTESIVKDPIFFKSGMTIAEAFKRFQKIKQHIAVVLDKDMKPIGTITMEDILEELVGEIEDEYDAEDDLEVSNYQKHITKELKDKSKNSSRQKN